MWHETKQARPAAIRFVLEPLSVSSLNGRPDDERSAVDLVSSLDGHSKLAEESHFSQIDQIHYSNCHSKEKNSCPRNPPVVEELPGFGSSFKSLETKIETSSKSSVGDDHVHEKSFLQRRLLRIEFISGWGDQVCGFC